MVESPRSESTGQGEGTANKELGGPIKPPGGPLFGLFQETEGIPLNSRWIRDDLTNNLLRFAPALVWRRQ